MIHDVELQWINNTHYWTGIDVIWVAVVILRFQVDSGVIICKGEAWFINICSSPHDNTRVLSSKRRAPASAISPRFHHTPEWTHIRPRRPSGSSWRWARRAPRCKRWAPLGRSTGPPTHAPDGSCSSSGPPCMTRGRTGQHLSHRCK